MTVEDLQSENFPRASTSDDQMQTQGLGLRERQKQKRREQILENARLLFNERGYEATLIDDIAAAAEVSPATVHNYYRGKWQILIELVDRCDTGIREDIAEIASKIGPKSQPEKIANQILMRITKGSLEALSHHVWRHAIATSITREDVEYGVSFSNAHKNFIHSIKDAVRILAVHGCLPDTVSAEIFASILYKIHHLLFVELIVEAQPDINKYRRMQQAHLKLMFQNSGLVS